MSRFGISHSRMESGFSSSISSQSFASSFRGASNPPNFGVSNSSRAKFGVSLSKNVPTFGVVKNGQPVQFGDSLKSNTLRIDASRFNSSLSRRNPPTAKSRTSLFPASNPMPTFLSPQSVDEVGGDFGASSSSSSRWNNQSDLLDTTFVGSFRRSGGGLLRRAVDELGRSASYKEPPISAMITGFRTSFNSPKTNLLAMGSGERVRAGIATVGGDNATVEPKLDHFGSMQTDWVSYQAQMELIKAKQKHQMTAD